MPKKNKALILVFSLGIFGIFINHTYRSYIHEHNYFDFHIADTIGSILCVTAITLFSYGQKNNKYSFNKLILYAFLFSVSYEIITIMLFHGTFDYYDLIAMLISTLITFFFYNLYKKHKKKLVVRSL